jgi:hypothetical protein
MAGEYNNNGGQQREMTGFDNPKLIMTADNDHGKKAQLRFGFNKGEPRITVWTNVEGDADSGRISANMDVPNFEKMLILLRHAIDFVPTPEKKEIGFKIENLKQRWVQKKPDGKMVESTTYVGKDANGVVYICIVAYDKSRPRIVFKFGTNDWHAYYHKTGEQFSEAEMSVLDATGRCNVLERLLSTIATQQLVPPRPRPNQGGNNNNNGSYQGSNNGGNGGGSNWNNNNGGGQRQQEIDDDMPF